MNERAVATALRAVAKGLIDLAAALDGNVPGAEFSARRAAVLRRLDVPGGLSGVEVSQVFRENGFDSRGIGSWVRHRLIYSAEGRRYLGAKGREWLEREQQSS